MNVPINTPYLLSLKLDDGDTSRYCRASVYNASGTEQAGSPFSLTHNANGTYISQAFNPTQVGFYRIDYEVFVDSSFLNADKSYSLESETIYASSSDSVVSSIDNKLTLTRASNLDKLDLSINFVNENIDKNDGRAVS